ncbi:MAG: hypothetical protein Q9206_002766 [Seirophora lacunosa]
MDEQRQLLGTRAQTCITELQALKHTTTLSRPIRPSATSSFLTDVAQLVDDNLQSLQTWNTEFAKQTLTEQNNVVEGVAPLFDSLHLFIECPGHDLRSRLLFGFLPGKRHDCEARVTLALTVVQRDWILYDEEEVDRAKAILQGLHQAWCSIEVSSLCPAPPELPNMAKILTRTWDERHHLEIEEEEPLPLKYIMEYNEGSYGKVAMVKDSFTGAFYAQKQQQTSAEAEKNAAYRKHLKEETEQPKNLRHNHVVQLVQSYQRGGVYAMILKPAATTDLERLILRYRDNKFDMVRQCKSRECHNICHNDIKPANILYEKAFDNHGARLLWADFGLAYDFSATGNSKTRTTRVYSCDMLRLKLQRRAPDSFLDEQPMSSQILTEFLRVLKNCDRRLSPLLGLAIGMISLQSKDRPTLADVVRDVALAGSRYFCDGCWNDRERGQAPQPTVGPPQATAGVESFSSRVPQEDQLD